MTLATKPLEKARPEQAFPEDVRARRPYFLSGGPLKAAARRAASIVSLLFLDLVGLALDATVADAVTLMRENALRRLPVVAGGRPIGIVSLGDLVTKRERESGKVLAGISTAPPNR